jgi:hypothetical protein
MPEDPLEPIVVEVSSAEQPTPTAPAWFWPCLASAVIVAALALVVIAAATVANWSTTRSRLREQVCLARVSVGRGDAPGSGQGGTAAGCH